MSVNYQRASLRSSAIPIAFTRFGAIAIRYLFVEQTSAERFVRPTSTSTSTSTSQPPTVYYTSPASGMSTFLSHFSSVFVQ